MREVVSIHSLAVYKGLKVAVYTTGMTDISLTRQDLVELINVRCLWLTSLEVRMIQYTFIDYMA